MDYDVVIVGAGPAGYLAGIRMAQLGANVLVLDKEGVGGECLNYACIPSKTLVYYASLFSRYLKLSRSGLFKGSIDIDLDILQDIKAKVVRTLTGGVSHLFKVNGVKYRRAEVKRILEDGVIIDRDGVDERIKADNIVLATGSRPIELPNSPFDHVNILNSRDALNLRTLPTTLLIVGGGAVGVEVGSYYNMLGCKVIIVELLDRLLPFMDRDIGNRLERELKKKGVSIYTSTHVKTISMRYGHVYVELENDTGTKSIAVDKVVVAIGRYPNTEGLGLTELGVKLDNKGFVIVDERQRTSVDNIYAVGDVTGPPMLAHKAYWEGLNVAETLFGDGPITPPKHYPFIVFSKPEVFSIGYSEEEASDLYGKVLVGRFPFSALGRAVSEGCREGFIKVVADPSSERVLGIHIVGYRASIYSAAASVIVENSMTLDEIDGTLFPHPTYGEGLWEAIRNASNKSLHTVNR